MKKILLSVSLLVATIAVQAQKEVVINEFVPDPNSNNEEYIELYNTTGSTINLDCYTVVTYDFLNGGVWTYNLPNVSIAPFGFLVISSSSTIDHKCGTTTTPADSIINWNGGVANSRLAYYVRNPDNTLTQTSLGPTTDFIPIAGGNSAALAVMLFNGSGTLTNGFFTNNGTTIPVEVTTLLPLNSFPIPSAGGCAATTSLVFSTISAPAAEVLQVQQAVGANNNYYRTRDGFCGTWVKGQTCNNPVEFSPAKRNSSLPPINTSTAVTVAGQEGACGGASNGTKTSWIISVQITDDNLLPATVRVYEDADFNGQLTAVDGAAVLNGTYNDVTNNAFAFYNVDLKRGSSAIVQIVTASGCLQITRLVPSGCIPLPVSFKSFTATRSHSNVSLRWETASEQNNSGFALERNVNGSWEQIAWVPSQALNGNSDATLSYSYNDVNTTKGISQYRIRQVDIDTKSKYSDIRSVRGEGQLGKTIVYPNPSNNGKVNVVFEDASVTRDISVSDMSGRVVRQVKGITNNNITIDNLAPGMYTIRIVAAETGEQVVEKLVVNKF